MKNADRVTLMLALVSLSACLSVEDARDMYPDRVTEIRCGEMVDTAYGGIATGIVRLQYYGADSMQVAITNPTNCQLRVIR